MLWLTVEPSLAWAQPMIVHQIEALRDAGVDEVVLAINYQPQVMYSFIDEYQAKLGVKITISQARAHATSLCAYSMLHAFFHSCGHLCFVLCAKINGLKQFVGPFTLCR